MDDISAAFSQILAISREGLALLEAAGENSRGLDAYFKLHRRRLELADRIEAREKTLQALTGQQTSPYQYRADVFADGVNYDVFSRKAAVIRQNINEIVANDRVITGHLQKLRDLTGSRLKSLEGNRKAAQAYNSTGPPPAWFIDRKK